MPVNEGTPRFRDIVISKILCRGAGRAVMLEGLPEMPIEGIVLEDVRMTATRGLATIDADAITLRRVDIGAAGGPVLAVRDSKNVTVEGGRAAPGAGVFLRVDGANSSAIRVTGVDVTGAKIAMETGAGVRPGAVVVK
jgi:hypothetical protein